MKNINLIITFLGFFFVSCNNETSLQEYYVENQDNTQFFTLDVPASLLTGENSNLDAEQKETLESIKKVNLIGFPINQENKAFYEEEKAKITSILKDEKYQTLMKYGGGTRRAELYYLGEDDAIDELIIFGMDEEKGFGVARVLGEDMKPEDLIQLVRSYIKGDLDVAGLQQFGAMFREKEDTVE